MTPRAARVLVAVDGSDFSLRAAKRGLELLAPTARPTVLLVVRQPTAVIPSPESATVPVTSIDEVTESERERARTEVTAAVHSLGVDADPRVEWGEPGATICAIAGEEHFDAVVVGSHGTGWMKRLLVGSVSHHVLHHAPCPVLVVREPPGDGEP